MKDILSFDESDAVVVVLNHTAIVEEEGGNPVVEVKEVCVLRPGETMDGLEDIFIMVEKEAYELVDEGTWRCEVRDGKGQVELTEAEVLSWDAGWQGAGAIGNGVDKAQKGSGKGGKGVGQGGC